MPSSLSKLEIPTSRFIKILLVLILLFWGAYQASSVLLPLLTALLLAVVLDRPKEKLIEWGVPKWAAISLSVLLLVLVFVALGGVLAWQIENITDSWKEIEQKSTQKIEQASQWSKQNLGFDPISRLSNSESVKDQLKSYAARMVAGLSTVLSQSLIILIYIILFLMQKNMFQNVLYKIAGQGEGSATYQIIKESGQTVSSYLIGKGKTILILFVVYYVGFLIGKVPYALFLALFAALFSIIPYLGNIIGGGAAIALASLYLGWTSGLIVLGVVSLTQVIESYVLTPYIIGNEIDLNPFMTIFSIVVFSSLWGVVGAVIALPITGIIKTILVHTKGLEPYAELFEKHKPSIPESY